VKKKARNRRTPAVRPTVAEINLSALSHNLQGVRKKVGSDVRIMAVVKANAYGHGLEAVSRHVETRKLADQFGVAFPEEGAALREAGIRRPIHVFTVPFPQQASYFVDFDLEASVCSVADAESLGTAAAKAKKTLPVHIKLDTGMNRIGVKPGDLDGVITALAKSRRLAVQGVFTHFATADETNKQFLMHQLAEFHRLLDRLRIAGVEPALVHCANSASILDVPEARFSMVRPGVMMYGYYPSLTTSESIPLKPVMTLKTRVAMVKWIGPGESVSYGRRFIATKRTQVATLPIGYADGYTRLLTGKTQVLVRGKKFPVVGAICMDQMMIDVGSDDISPGDEAVLVGHQDGASLSAWDLASALGTIPYEICCAISSRVPRVFIS
jgi:alanine racemase